MFSGSKENPPAKAGTTISMTSKFLDDWIPNQVRYDKKGSWGAGPTASQIEFGVTVSRTGGGAGTCCEQVVALGVRVVCWRVGLRG